MAAIETQQLSQASERLTGSAAANPGGDLLFTFSATLQETAERSALHTSPGTLSARSVGPEIRSGASNSKDSLHASEQVLKQPSPDSLHEPALKADTGEEIQAAEEDVGSESSISNLIKNLKPEAKPIHEVIGAGSGSLQKAEHTEESGAGLKIAPKEVHAGPSGQSSGEGKVTRQETPGRRHPRLERETSDGARRVEIAGSSLALTASPVPVELSAAYSVSQGGAQTSEPFSGQSRLIALPGFTPESSAADASLLVGVSSAVLKKIGSEQAQSTSSEEVGSDVQANSTTPVGFDLPAISKSGIIHDEAVPGSQARVESSSSLSPAPLSPNSGNADGPAVTQDRDLPGRALPPAALDESGGIGQMAQANKASDAAADVPAAKKEAEAGIEAGVDSGLDLRRDPFVISVAEDAPPQPVTELQVSKSGPKHEAPATAVSKESRVSTTASGPAPDPAPEHSGATVAEGSNTIPGPSAAGVTVTQIPDTAAARGNHGEPNTITSGLNGTSIVSREAEAGAHVQTPSFEQHPQTLIATPTTLEVGVPHGTAGWLKVRAEIGGQGEVNASLATDSTAGRELLHRQLPALSAYLHNEQIAVTTTVAERGSAAFGGAAGLLPGGADAFRRSSDSSLLQQPGTSQGGDQGAHEQRRQEQSPARTLATGVGEGYADPSVNVKGALARAGLGAAGLEAERGSWLNVRV